MVLPSPTVTTRITLSSPATASCPPSPLKASAVDPVGNGPSFLISLPSVAETMRTILFPSPMATWLPLPFNPSATTGWSLPAISEPSFPSPSDQILTTLSAPAVAALLRSPLKAQTWTGLLASRRCGSTIGSCQSRARPSEPDETSHGLPGTCERARTLGVGVSMTPSGVKSAFQRRIRRDVSPAASWAPSCRHARLTTSPSAPSRSLIAVPLSRSQILTERPDAAAACCPSGFTARAATIDPCLDNDLIGASEGQSQTLAVLSRLPERSCLPSGEKATDSTSFECPSNVLSSFRVAASQSRTVLSNPAVA